MSVYEDADNAILKISRLYEHYDKTLMNKFSEIYPFTTENLQGYFSKFHFKDKAVLTVGSSADQVLNAILLGCKDITCFDVNPFVKYYFDLKKAAIKTLNHNEFLDFFCFRHYPDWRDNEDVFSDKIYRKISQNLSEDGRIFWDKLYLEFYNTEIRKNLFSYDEDNHSVIQNTNKYLNPKQYDILKTMIDKVEPKFITSNLKSITKKTDKKYDYIFLSNISAYLEDLFDSQSLVKYKTILDSLNEKLTNTGKIAIAYLYSVKSKFGTAHNSLKVSNKEEMEKVFGKDKLEYKDFIGVRGLLFENKSVKDEIIIYPKNCQKKNETEFSK